MLIHDCTTIRITMYFYLVMIYMLVKKYNVFVRLWFMTFDKDTTVKYACMYMHSRVMFWKSKAAFSYRSMIYTYRASIYGSFKSSITSTLIEQL